MGVITVVNGRQAVVQRKGPPTNSEITEVWLTCTDFFSMIRPPRTNAETSKLNSFCRRLRSMFESFSLGQVRERIGLVIKMDQKAIDESYEFFNVADYLCRLALDLDQTEVYSALFKIRCEVTRSVEVKYL